MDAKKRAGYNALRDWRLPNVVRDIGLTGEAQRVALAGQLGTGIEVGRRTRNGEKAARAARRKTAKAARRRNR